MGEESQEQIESPPFTREALLKLLKEDREVQEVIRRLVKDDRELLNRLGAAGVL